MKNIDKASLEKAYHPFEIIDINHMEIGATKEFTANSSIFI